MRFISYIYFIFLLLSINILVGQEVKELKNKELNHLIKNGDIDLPSMVYNTKSFTANSFGNCMDLQFEEFTADGTFNVPAGVKVVWVCAVGGGGGGGSAAKCDDSYSCSGGLCDFSSGGGGGGGGQSFYFHPVDVTPEEAIAVTIGDGGDGGVPTASSGSIGDDGEPTIFGSYITAYGGIGGEYGFESSINDGGMWYFSLGGDGGSGGPDGVGGQGGEHAVYIGHTAHPTFSSGTEDGYGSQYSIETIVPGSGGGAGQAASTGNDDETIAGIGAGSLIYLGGEVTFPTGHGGNGGGGGSTMFGQGAQGGQATSFPSGGNGEDGHDGDANTGVGGGGGSGGTDIVTAASGGKGGSGYLVVFWVE
jgi:hypothetical protein